jgi:hypothetical protein
MIEYGYQVLIGAENHAVALEGRAVKSPLKIKVTLSRLVGDCLRHVRFSIWP